MPCTLFSSHSLSAQPPPPPVLLSHRFFHPISPDIQGKILIIFPIFAMVILPDFKGRYHSTVFNEYFFCRHRKKGEPEGPDYFNMCILIGVLLFCPALLFPAFVTGFSQRFYSLGQRKQFRYFFFDFGNGLRSFYHHVRGRPAFPGKK